MALTIMGGLFVATFLTILFLPALYALWFRRNLETRLGDVPEVAPKGRLNVGAPRLLGEGAE